MATQKSLVGTRTQVNLANAYVSESCAYTRYTFFAQAAQKESYFQYANILNETAANELRHAKIFLKFLDEGGCKTDPISIDAGVIGKTVDNLKVAAEEERVEGVEQYTESAKVADEEGFSEIAKRFKEIAEIEQRHRDRFDKMIKRIEDGTVWKSDKPIKWQCLVCGYIYEGTTPPEKCPACQHPYQHFEREEDNV
jgi:rubrerythrin